MKAEDVRSQNPVSLDVGLIEAREEILRLLRMTFETSKEARRWWRSPHPLMAGVAPLAAAKTLAGAVRVRDMLIALRYGGVV
jgi:uncharacterized protein (DUF2384 family)